MIHTTQGVALCYVVLPLQGVCSRPARQMYSVQGVALRYVDYALTGRFSLRMVVVLCTLYSRYRHDCTPKVVAMAVRIVMTICRICFQTGDLVCIDIKVIRL